MTDHTDIVRNWRGKYPPVAILENTRRALSASAHSAKREQVAGLKMLIDLSTMYLEVLEMENYIRTVNHINTIDNIPKWVVDTVRLSDPGAFR